jgi:hypothetical protein
VVARLHEDDSNSNPTLPREFKARCAAKGNFEIQGIPPEHRDIRLRIEVWNALTVSEPLEAPVVVLPGKTGVVLKLRPRAWCTFIALDGDSLTPIASPTARFDFYNLKSLRSRLDVSGEIIPLRPKGSRIRLPVVEAPGARIGIVVGAEGYNSYYVAGVHPESGATLDLGEIVLSPRPTLRVTVRDARTGEPIPRAVVFTAEEPIEAAEDAPEFERAAVGTERFYFAPARYIVRTDESGNATVQGSSTAPLWITAGHLDFAVADPIRIETCDDMGQVTIDLQVGASLKVTVLKGAEAQKGAIVTLETPDEAPLGALLDPRNRRIDSREATDDVGQCQFSHLRPGTFVVRVGSPTEASASVAVLGDEVQEVTLIRD